MIPLNGIVFGGSGASRNVKLTPSLNQSGTTTITVTVSDGVLSASDSFEVTVNAINDKPVISGVLDQVTSENTATDPVAFTISDIETAAGSLTLTKQTSNSAVVPLSGILLSGTGGSRTVAIQPASNAGGSSMITLTVSDGSLSESITFKVTVIDTHNPADLLWNGGNENWNFTAANWHFVSENGSVNTAWSDSNRAVFSGTAGTVNLTANVKASRLDFLSNYIVQGTGGLTVDPGVGAAQAVVSVGSSVSAKLGSRLLGTSDLVKSGPGMLVLDGNNTFSGHLKIEQGIIQASQDSALGQGGAASDTGTQIIAGASLEITGSSRLGENLRMAGDGTDGSGAVLSVSGVNAIEEKIALDGDATVGVTAGSLDISGILYQDTGTRNLSKRGAGTLILSGVNTYNGTTTVTAGILRAKNSKALGTGGFTSQTLTSIAPGAAVELEGG